jgi:bifunctional DNA-binding transcriptional regulator/antitoxin component of YhaV-PrlF toxin-antitoxin module
MTVTNKGQVTLPPAMRKKHGLLPKSQVKFIDRPEGVLVVKVKTPSRGRQVVAAMLRGGKIKGRTEDWLKLTRGDT